VHIGLRLTTCMCLSLPQRKTCIICFTEIKGQQGIYLNVDHSKNSMEDTGDHFTKGLNS
jgi:hypothetical protein